MPDPATRANALDHVVVVLFENRSLDNVLGRLYGPGDGKTFEGVIGKELRNPIPGWAEHGARPQGGALRRRCRHGLPNPDSGEEWYHVNTQVFGETTPIAPGLPTSGTQSQLLPDLATSGNLLACHYRRAITPHCANRVILVSSACSLCPAS
jgi:hypothetical protein